MERLTQNDIAIAGVLKRLVHKGKFELMGDALVQSGALFQWLDNLDKRIEETLKPVVNPVINLQAEQPEKRKK
jgi:hypothetical protein